MPSTLGVTDDSVVSRRGRFVTTCAASRPRDRLDLLVAARQERAATGKFAIVAAGRAGSHVLADSSRYASKAVDVIRGGDADPEDWVRALQRQLLHSKERSQ